MKLFLSWSGQPSLKMAKALMEFLPCVLEGLKVFLSTEGIRKGADWLSVIRGELDTTDFGILCLTKEALTSDWLIFEAGAIAKKVEDARVVPVLLGIADVDVTGPLSKFQAMAPDKEEFWRLTQQMNELAGEANLGAEILKRRFDKWWPDLESETSKVLANLGAASAPPPTRKLDDMVAEMLGIVRHLASMNIITVSPPQSLSDLVATTAVRHAAIEARKVSENPTARALIERILDEHDGAEPKEGMLSRLGAMPPPEPKEKKKK